MQVVFFEDQFTKEIRPVTLTRAAFNIMVGGLDLETAIRKTGLPISYIVRSYLRPVVELELENAPLTDTEVLFVNASLVPRLSDLEDILAICSKKERFSLMQGERVAVSYFPKKKVRLEGLNPDNITGYLQEDNPPPADKKVPLINRPYEIVKYNMEIVADNLERMAGAYHRLDKGVYAGQNVRVSKFVSFDTSEGPVIIDNNSFVENFVLFHGPVYLGKNSRVNEHSALKDCCSIGNTVKAGGEIEAAVIESYSNKQHHGFLGHAYLGSWINLGAGTCNSDLKNTYGKVKVLHRGVKEDTGMQFLGCIIGDYSKTAINSCIFTGKTIGVSSMVYGFATENVPSFTNWGKSLGSVTKFNLDAALTTQKRMFE
ncbi:MAG TPA: putative sugar nucleotidyl transferase, partial [archaeon]|nr:putative sugar nucleotidyl transferase [archaeon]